MSIKILEKINVSEELKDILTSKNIVIPETRNEIIELAMGGAGKDFFEVAYDVPNKGRVVEATVARCKNGLAVNYLEEYMRRRDPKCMYVADEKETDKVRYEDAFGEEFNNVRLKTFEWLRTQDLIVMPFMAGGEELGYQALLVAPINVGFFAGGLADLQGFIPKSKIPKDFTPKSIIYVAPTFRHTHFNGKQVVVHNRTEEMHELFSYNLYPGPSAKKGVYGMLLNIGEHEGWITAHASTTRVITPYDNVITIMHEGASGGGKSEMSEEMHRESNGKFVLAKHLQTGEKLYFQLKENCELQPVVDDMAVCHPSIQNNKKLVVKDAEDGWFVRVNHIDKYGTDPHYEKMCIYPKEPLIFLNMDAVPNSTCLIWEHKMDAPGKPCPNPRVIIPRRLVSDIVDEPVEIDVRSFGVRTPPCTKENPTYGIIGMLHVLPPSLAWLWRLVAPRGHDNPSISDSKGMSSEGVGSYWPFATGKRVDQANLLLRQILNTPNTRYIIMPNQHIGVYKVGFMGQWVGREYLARRGSAKFRPEQIVESRCPLLGYSLETLKLEGVFLPKGLLQTNFQPEVGNVGYDKGAEILKDFFKKELAKFDSPKLDTIGRKIIECCMNDGKVEDYAKLIDMRF